MRDEDQQYDVVDEPGVARMRHTIKASRLLYSVPGFILRGPIYLIGLIMLAALIYSFWAKKDELVVAPLELQRESYTVQSVGSGLVSDVLTEEGAHITAGDPIARVQEQIRVAMSPEQEALVSQRWELEKELDKARKDYNHQIDQLERDLIDLRTGRSTQKAGLSAQVSQIKFQLATARRAKTSAERRLDLARKRLATKEELYKTRDITITEYEEAQESVNELERSVEDSQAEIHKILLNLETARQEKAKVESQHQEEKLVADLEKAKANKTRDVKDLTERIESITGRLEGVDMLVPGVDYKSNTARYKSKFDGLVTKVHIKKGQLIDSGSPIATVVKNSAALEGRVMVQNADIGRVKYGQTVQIKYFAYPYQDHGIQSGTIIHIATHPSGGAEGEAGSMYEVRVALYSETVQKLGGRPKKLEIGLEGMAEIKTGEKRFIELVFAPVSKFFVDPDE